MCGICGTLQFDGRPVNKQLLEAMEGVLHHRGPDGCGSNLLLKDDTDALGTRAWFGHKRLSILDLSAAAQQPMCNEDGTIWLTYNGEIYNYRELRCELKAKGHRFRSDSDTEVVIHLYEEEGLEAVKRFNGMFAFGLWDKKRERLWLCRDRVGIKPLVYSWDGARLLFASEIKALLTDPTVDKQLDQLRAGPADNVSGDQKIGARLLVGP